ncbi:hypothetical protein BpHYR1_054375 [Brachionus plicatilis]|uniref:Uncharacterized protein n=1 Tax=Brachionus plicatilis TaxID=10195 RepID=A0A3M7PBY7_BRAPC|nr:hypothetical protein BpHYR1_054375 [Brachionus plicatilis]
MNYCLLQAIKYLYSKIRNLNSPRNDFNMTYEQNKSQNLWAKNIFLNIFKRSQIFLIANLNILFSMPKLFNIQIIKFVQKSRGCLFDY